MTDFSFRRMVRLCRLQTECTWAGSWKRLAGVFAGAVIFLCILPMLGGWKDPEEMMKVTEDLLKILIATQIFGIYASMMRTDLPVSWIMAPASPLEKYVSIYANAAMLGMLTLAVSVIAGSGIYWTACQIFLPDMSGGPGLLFFRQGRSMLVDLAEVCMLSSAIVCFLPFIRRKKKYSQTFFWTVITVFVLLLCAAPVLFLAGVVTKAVATLMTGIILPAMTVANLVWGYSLFRKFEFDMSDD